jgi:tetratricopeptide (TPR) repeat protein
MMAPLLAALVLPMFGAAFGGADIGAAAEARRLFDLGDYPGAERELEKVIADLPEGSRSERAVRLAQLAEVRVLQGIGEAASKDIQSAIALDPSPAVRRSAVVVYLRCQRFREALSVAEDLLAAAPADSSLRLSRGIALARLGQLERALPGLTAGLDAPGARREARFELALALSKLGRPEESLVRLREILEEDPYDAEACYQATRQLLRLRRPEASRMAALLTRYFEALREAEGASSRDAHLELAGKAADAALERAAKWERLGDYARALADAERARRSAGGGGSANAWLAGFYRRQGFDEDVSTEELTSALAAQLAGGDDPRVQRIARLLLAREPGSVAALTCLMDRTADPSLVVPRLHYAKRLADADPSTVRWKAEATTLRAAIEGASPRR